MGDHDVRAGCRGRRTRARHSGADQLQEPVTESLVPWRLPVGRDLLGPGYETGPGLGIGIGRELCADCAEGVVEAQIVRRAARGPGRRRCGGAGDLGQLTERAHSGLVGELLIGVGGRHVDDRTHLVEGHVARTQRPHQVREVAGPLADACQCPRRSRRHPEALHRPGVGGGRSVVSERLSSSGLAQVDEEAPLGGRLLLEGLFETCHQLLVRESSHSADQVGTMRGHCNVGPGHQL